MLPLEVSVSPLCSNLDIKNIGLVINFDFPSTIQDYVHRIGRTGRAGSKGTSYTFFTMNDISFCRDFIHVCPMV
jgi:ATP-dependent RNA helicase DDX5/DBP2